MSHYPLSFIPYLMRVIGKTSYQSKSPTRKNANASNSKNILNIIAKCNVKNVIRFSINLYNIGLHHYHQDIPIFHYKLSFLEDMFRHYIEMLLWDTLFLNKQIINAGKHQSKNDSLNG